MDELEYVAQEPLYLDDVLVANPGDRFLATPETLDERGWSTKASPFDPDAT